MAVDAAVWCRLQLAVVGAHINAAAPLVSIYGLPRGLSMVITIALLHGASARYLINAAAESADGYGAVAASCGLGRRQRAMADGPRSSSSRPLCRAPRERGRGARGLR